MEDRYLSKAKRLDNGEWVQGYYVKGLDVFTNCEEAHIIFEPNTMFYSSGETDGWYKVDPSTICRCTGLKDKNGKLIWENDIIECKNRKHNFQTQIEWDAYCAGFIFQDTETSAVGLDAITANGLYSESKVIGNIFDNPELVESEEN